MAKPNPAGGSGEEEGRDSWCTPKWLTTVIGLVDLDPCSNPRSSVTALIKVSLESGGDGLVTAGLPGSFCSNGYTYTANNNYTTFINPPYKQGEVIKWVRHYRHTKFIFLLRWDPSTEWFRELIQHCDYVWFPNKRINFEPPPDVKSSSNPFPHALYLRRPSEALLERLSHEGYLFEVDERFVKPQSTRHADDTLQQDTGSNTKGTDGTHGTGGGGEGFRGIDRTSQPPIDWSKIQKDGTGKYIVDYGQGLTDYIPQGFTQTYKDPINRREYYYDFKKGKWRWRSDAEKALDNSYGYGEWYRATFKVQ